ncbi:hypothetical protein Nepgr_000403 [Nepenthes gracilis]|uniref:Protein NUCLEAR FUSION DEFECTIVE 6, chloroplastic/mitochondrial-like n=1 Tax=Nepenthes gracilis TaxID=150966 RepID=A0AAD3RW77_NEPGR|nr:hypothetical protein Nepgr_000403 [Nepenthes gracilis]
MATLTGARSILRSTLVRDAAARIASGANAARSPVRMATDKPVSSRIFRCPAELCACLETMPPFLTVTTSVLMMSMLFGSRNSYSSLAEGNQFQLKSSVELTFSIQSACNDDV